MNSTCQKSDLDRFGEMKDKIEAIERLVGDLKKLGKGMPVMEKNLRSISSFLYVLKFGVSDVAEILEA